MSEGKPHITWTCDRCGRQIVVESSAQPPGWIGIILLDPPRRDPDSSKIRSIFCRDCDSSYADWLQSGRVPSAARPSEPREPEPLDVRSDLEDTGEAER